MKRVLSIAAAIALIFALSVPAFAATPSVTYAQDSVKTDTTVETESGEVLTVEVTEAKMSETEGNALPDAIDKAVQKAYESGDIPQGTTASAVEVVNVDLVDEKGNVVSEDYFETVATITVAFARDDTTKEVIAVLYWNAETEEWDPAPFEAKDGKIVATFEHLCTVSFVLADVETDNPGTNPGGETGGSTPTGKKDPGKSPQTGYDTFGWMAAVAALTLGAGYCFVSARKKVEE